MIEIGKDVFESATVDCCIFLFSKKPESKYLKACKHQSNFQLWNISEDQWCDIIPSDKTWAILSPKEQLIKNKIDKIGKPLCELGVKIDFGVKTGLNEAFIISEELKNKLILEDVNSSKIIKPVLREETLQVSLRFLFFLLDVHNGYGATPAVDIDEFLSVKKHLNQFKQKLESRNDKGETAYNLRSCAYHENFEKDKLAWIELADKGRFSFVDGGVYCEASTFIMTGENLKYLLAILNSNITNWYFPLICPTSGMGTNRWKKAYLHILPIVLTSSTEMDRITKIVDEMILAKKTGNQLKLEELEQQINKSVYKIYGLSDDESEFIESLLN